MRTPQALLKFIGKALLSALGGRVLGDIFDFATEVLPEVAADVQEWWVRETDEAQRRAELQALAQASAKQFQQAVDQILEEIARHESEPVRQTVRAYLQQIPATIRRTLRRPADPSGTTIPPTVRLRHAEDLLPFLPTRLPRYRIGDRPILGVDRELVELLGVGGFGEVWKARTASAATPWVALKFCLDPKAGDLWRHEAALLERVQVYGQHPGIVQLRHIYLHLSPPCLEYAYVEGGDLAGLVQEMHAPPKPPAARLYHQATTHVLELARIVGFAHRLHETIVHRDLKPANILVRRDENRSVQLWVADFGIGGVASSRSLTESRIPMRNQVLVTALRGTHTPLYASPQQIHGELADPRDDVFALGVIWYQMLTGDLTQGRPGGIRWMKRLVEQGLSAELADLLAACFEELPEDRPHDAEALADALAVALSRAAPPQPSCVVHEGAVHWIGGLRSFPGIPAAVESVAFSPDGRRVVSGGSEALLRLWDVQSGRELHRMQTKREGFPAVAFSPDGKEIASGGRDHVVRVWDCETSWERRHFEGHDARLLAVAFTPDGKRVLSAGAERQVCVWDLERSRCLRAWMASQDLTWNAAAFSRDGRFLLSGCPDGEVRLWSVESGKLLRSLGRQDGAVLCVALSPEGRWAYSGGWDRVVHVWDVHNGKDHSVLDGHFGWVWSLAASADGKRVLSGGADQTVRLWDLETRQEVLRFERHFKTVQAVAFAPDGQMALSGGTDRQLCLWGLPE